MEAIVFDFDGTLLDSMTMWQSLSKRFLEKRGIEVTEELGKILTTLSVTQTPPFLREQFDLHVTSEEMYGEMGPIITESYEKILPLKEGALALVQYFYEAGYPLAIASATNEAYIHLALRRLEMEQYFRFIQTCDGVGFGKNDLRFYEVLEERMGVPASKTYYIDDAPHALEAATKYGFYTIGVRDVTNEEMWEDVRENSKVQLLCLADFHNVLK